MCTKWRKTGTCNSKMHWVYGYMDSAAFANELKSNQPTNKPLWILWFYTLLFSSKLKAIHGHSLLVPLVLPQWWVFSNLHRSCTDKEAVIVTEGLTGPSLSLVAVSHLSCYLSLWTHPPWKIFNDALHFNWRSTPQADLSSWAHVKCITSAQ